MSPGPKICHSSLVSGLVGSRIRALRHVASASRTTRASASRRCGGARRWATRCPPTGPACWGWPAAPPERRPSRGPHRAALSGRSKKLGLVGQLSWVSELEEGHQPSLAGGQVAGPSGTSVSSGMSKKVFLRAGFKGEVRPGGLHSRPFGTMVKPPALLSTDHALGARESAAEHMPRGPNGTTRPY